MRSCAACFVVLLAACATETDPDVRVERQAAAIADIKASNWAEGGAVLVAVPGTFTFPQPLSVRISVVDSKDLTADGVPTQLGVMTASVGIFDQGPLEIARQPACQQNYCTAELRVTAQGSGMLTIITDGAAGTQKDCFYYGIYEAADPAAAGMMYQTQLEKQQYDCRATFWN